MSYKFQYPELTYIGMPIAKDPLAELQQGVVFYLSVTQESIASHPRWTTNLVLRHKDGTIIDLMYLWDVARLSCELPGTFGSLHRFLTRTFKEQYQGAIDQNGQVIDL